jgi:hypothetical protein
MATTTHTHRVFASALAAALAASLSTLALAACLPGAAPLRSGTLNSIGAPGDVADVDGYGAVMDIL